MAKKYYKEDGQAIPAIVFADSAPAGFTEIVDVTELKALHCKRYIQAEKDGHDFYNEFRTGLYMDIVSATITSTEAFLLEQHLKDVAEQIISGNWLTAQNTSTNLALSGIYDQALKDKIQSAIDTYVTENY